MLQRLSGWGGEDVAAGSLLLGETLPDVVAGLVGGSSSSELLSHLAVSSGGSSAVCGGIVYGVG